MKTNSPNKFRSASLLLVAVGLSACVLSTSPAQAQVTRTWINDASNTSFYNQAGAWSGGVRPASGDRALFDGSPINKQPVLGGSRGDLIGIDFQTGGWSFTSNSTDLWEFWVANSTLVTDGTRNYAVRLADNIGAVTLSPEVLLRQQGALGNWYIGTGSRLIANRGLWFEQNATFYGAGTVVMGGTVAGGQLGFNAAGGGTVLVNGSTGFMQDQTSNSAMKFTGAGTTLGGSGTINGASASRFNPIFGTGTVLSPGGTYLGSDNTTVVGSNIGMLTFNLTSPDLNAITNRIDLQAGSALRMDLGIGVSDKLVINATTRGGFLNLDTTGVGVRLDLWGTAVGSYTLVEMANLQNVVNYGTFSSIFYNGVDVTSNPDFTVTYNTNSIVLGVIPEPSTLGFLMASALAFFATSRRRRQSA